MQPGAKFWDVLGLWNKVQTSGHFWKPQTERCSERYSYVGSLESAEDRGSEFGFLIPEVYFIKQLSSGLSLKQSMFSLDAAWPKVIPDLGLLVSSYML